MDKKFFLYKTRECIDHLDGPSAFKVLLKMSQEDRNLFLSKKDTAEALNLLQFVAIPFLEINKVAELISKHLKLALLQEDIDVCERLKNFFISFDLFDRDDKKEELRKHLLSNKETIFQEPIYIKDGVKLQYISDWIVDFSSHVDIQHNALKEAQYFSTRLSSLNEEKKNILKKIFSIYKYLSSSSLGPMGFEDDLLMKTEDGKTITTKNGEVIVLYDPKKEVIIQRIKADNTNAINFKKKDNVKEYLTNEDQIALENDEEKSLNNEKIDKKQNEEDLSLKSLNAALANYRPSSLEYKAIKEEIARLRKGQS